RPRCSDVCDGTSLLCKRSDRSKCGEARARVA
ncbi:TraY domain-containing protein, partial [Leptospira wolffii]